MKMAKLVICRLCLSQNVRMYNIENTLIQETYETLTNIPLASDSSSHNILACYMCYSILQRSLLLQQQCIAVNNQEGHVEVMDHTPHHVDREIYKRKHRLEQSQVRITDSTKLIPGNCDVPKSIKKEESMEYENIDTLLDAIKGTTPAKRQKLQETHQQQREGTQNNVIYEVSIQLDINQEPKKTVNFLKKNKQMDFVPSNRDIIEATVKNEINDSESRLAIVSDEPSDCKPLLSEPDRGKESLKSIYYYCHNCEYRSVTKYSLKKHMGSHAESQGFLYNTHLSNINFSCKPFSCNICKYKCLQKRDLMIHLLAHSSEKPFVCEICTYKCTQKSRLKAHLLNHFGDKPFSCNICKYKCLREKDLKTHLFTHTGEKPFACKICMYKCRGSSNLKRHLLTHSSDKPFACNICMYTSSDKGNLNRHLISHSNEKPFSCNYCTYKTTSKCYLKNHMLIHTGDKPFACNICSFKCRQKGALNKHLLTHTGDKPFLCDICSFRCSYKSNLKKHLFTHTGEKPFICTICANKFTTKRRLKTHLMTHSGDKPFACNICTYKVTQRSSLKRHLLTHSSDKPFACNICTHKYTTKGSLKKHLLSHSGNKPFACNICMYRYTSKSSLKRHLLTHS